MLRSKAEEMFKKAKDAIQNKSDTEKMLDEALSKKEWGASSSLMNEIARLTFVYTEYPVIMRAVWESLNQDGKHWRVILKGLQLLDHLVKLGAERVVDDARDHLFRIKILIDFTYHDEQGLDRAAGIREKAKSLAGLLNDTETLREERNKARQLQNKFVGIGGGRPAITAIGVHEPMGSTHNMGRRQNFGGGFHDDQIGAGPRYGVSARGYSERTPKHDQSRTSSASSTSNITPRNDTGRRGRKPHAQRHRDYDDQLGNNSPSLDQFDVSKDRGTKLNIKFKSSSRITDTRSRPADEDEFEDFSPFGEEASKPHQHTTQTNQSRRANVAPPTTEDTFDPFDEPSSNVQPSSQNQIASDDLDDVFSGPASSNAVPTQPTSQSQFDPFDAPQASNAGPVTGQSNNAGGQSNDMEDLFGTGQISSMPTAGEASDPFATSSYMGGADLFSGNTTQPQNSSFVNNQTNNIPNHVQAVQKAPSDQDLDRLVSLDGLSLGDKRSNTSVSASSARRRGPAMNMSAVKTSESHSTGLEGGPQHGALNGMGWQQQQQPGYNGHVGHSYPYNAGGMQMPPQGPPQHGYPPQMSGYGANQGYGIRPQQQQWQAAPNNFQNAPMGYTAGSFGNSPAPHTGFGGSQQQPPSQPPKQQSSMDFDPFA